MPNYDWMITSGERKGEVFERYVPLDELGKPPTHLLVDEYDVAERLPCAPTFKIEDGTEKFYKDKGYRVIEPGHNRDVAQNLADRKAREDKQRKKDLEAIFPEAYEEASAVASI